MRISGPRASGSSFTGTNDGTWGAVTAVSGSLDSIQMPDFADAVHPASTIQRRTRLAFNPLASATAAIDTLGRRQASTSSLFNSSLCRRRRRPGNAGEINVVCTCPPKLGGHEIPTARQVLQDAMAGRLRLTGVHPILKCRTVSIGVAGSREKVAHFLAGADACCVGSILVSARHHVAKCSAARVWCPAEHPSARCTIGS